VAIKVRSKDVFLLMTMEVSLLAKGIRAQRKTLYNVDEKGQAGKCNCQNPVKQSNDRE
jgi:hypothetical protein